MNNTSLESANAYASRGWSPIPIEYKGKFPKTKDWPELRITHVTVPQYFNGAEQNVGVLTGAASNDLGDVDLDHRLAVQLAPDFLPQTPSKFGRRSNPDSHWLYYVTGGTGPLAQFKDSEGMLVELRGDGCQTVFPGSTHTSGEAVEWSEDGEPAAVPRAVLLGRIRLLATATLIGKRWKGNRDELCAAVVGAMLRASHTPEAIAHVKHFVTAICRAVGDEEVRKRVEKIRRFASALEGRDRGAQRKVPGLPQLAKVTDQETADLFAKWLDLAPTASWSPPHDFLHEGAARAFTADDVPPCIAEFAVSWAQAAGFDPTGVIASCVVSAAAALNDGIRLEVQQATAWYESARLWAVLFADPGHAKSPMIRAGVGPLQELHREKVEAFAADEIARESENKGSRGEPGEPKEPLPALVTNDSTTEKLSEVLRDNPGGILYLAEEADSWLGTHDAYRANGGARDRGEWLTLFDGGPHQVDRIKRGSYFVANWGVSLLSATTPAAVQKLVDRLPNDGLLQRILPFVIAAPSAPDPNVAVRAAANRYRSLIRAIHSFEPYCGPVPTDEEDA